MSVVECTHTERITLQKKMYNNSASTLIRDESEKKKRRKTPYNQGAFSTEIWTEISTFCKMKTIKKSIACLNNPIRDAIQEKYHKELSTFQEDLDKTFGETKNMCKEFIFQERKMDRIDRIEREKEEQKKLSGVSEGLAKLEVKHKCSGYIINVLLLHFSRAVLEVLERREEDDDDDFVCIGEPMVFRRYTDSRSVNRSKERNKKRCTVSRFEILMEHVLHADEVKHRRLTRKQAASIARYWRVYDSRMRRIILGNHRKLYTTRTWFIERLTHHFEMDHMPYISINDPETVKKLNEGFDYSERETVVNISVEDENYHYMKDGSCNVKYGPSASFVNDGGYPMFLCNYWPADGRVTQWQAGPRQPEGIDNLGEWKPLSVEVCMFLDAVDVMGKSMVKNENNISHWMIKTKELFGHATEDVSKMFFVTQGLRGRKCDPKFIREGRPELFGSLSGPVHQLRKMHGFYHLLDVHKPVIRTHKMFFHPCQVYERP